MSWLDDATDASFAAFTEGWALYSENPIMSDDTDLYNDNPIQKFGMLKWQVSILDISTLSTEGLSIYKYPYPWRQLIFIWS